jgi:CRISPR-associated protein Csb1
MPLNLMPLDNASRLRVEARLLVATGTGSRFQPTGFPDLGPALYKGFRTPSDRAERDPTVPDPVDMLLVESVQSMANRLEEVCLQGEDYNSDCQGIPYARVLDGHQNKAFLTSSVREPHRLASPYVLGAKDNGQVYRETLKAKDALNANKERPVHVWKIVPEIFKRDPGCVLHGVFLEEIDGRIRLPRLVSGYIEACSPNQANSGGVYRGEVTAKDNIPYPRQEFTSPAISASFIFHLATLNSYNLDEDKRRFLQSWALYKIDRFLHGQLRLRTACEFKVDDIKVFLDEVSHSLVNDGDLGRWPVSEEIRSTFITAKDRCFPQQSGDDEWKRRRVQVLIYAVDIVGAAPLEGVAQESFDLKGFEGRAEVKGLTTGQGKKKKTVTALVLTGEWPEEDQARLLEQNPPKKENEEGEEIDNPARSVVENAVKDWNDKWKRQQKKAAIEEKPVE